MIFTSCEEITLWKRELKERCCGAWPTMKAPSQQLPILKSENPMNIPQRPFHTNFFQLHHLRHLFSA